MNSERILYTRALIKSDTDFQKDGLTADKDTVEGEKQTLFNVLSKSLDKKGSKIVEYSLDNTGAEAGTTEA